MYFSRLSRNICLIFPLRISRNLSLSCWLGEQDLFILILMEFFFLMSWRISLFIHGRWLRAGSFFVGTKSDTAARNAFLQSRQSWSISPSFEISSTRSREWRCDRRPSKPARRWLNTVLFNFAMGSHDRKRSKIIALWSVEISVCNGSKTSFILIRSGTSDDKVENVFSSSRTCIYLLQEKSFSTLTNACSFPPDPFSPASFRTRTVSRWNRQQSQFPNDVCKHLAEKIQIYPSFFSVLGAITRTNEHFHVKWSCNFRHCNL